MTEKIHKTFKKTCAFLLYAICVSTTYAQCAAPRFEQLEHEQDDVETSSWISLSVGPGLASLNIPANFTHLSVTDDGSLIFSRNNKNDFKGIVGLEKTGDYHEDRNIVSTIQPFYKKIFTSPDGAYCDYFETFRLENQDYRLHVQLKGGEIFAFGKKDKHRFYILIDKKPDIIVSANIQNINLNHFKHILNSIKIKE